jgi:surface polysaccharide O-acyltransferase-like enzyme
MCSPGYDTLRRRNIERKTLECTLAVLFVFTSIIPLLKTIFLFNIRFYILLNSVYIFYFLFGHYIHHYKITVNTKVLIGVMLLYCLYATVMPLNKQMILQSSSGRLLSLEQESPLVAMVACALFCFFRQKSTTNRIIDSLSSLCFGIYLIHPLFLFSLFLFFHFTPEAYPLGIVIFGSFMITTILSTVFSYYERKIVKHISKKIIF